MFNRTINPGQLVIFRDILAYTTAGDTDIAVFSDLRANYDITNNDDGTISVAHASGTQLDGVDTLRNIERMRFSAIEKGVNHPATVHTVIRELKPREGLQLTVNPAKIGHTNGLGA